MGQRPIAVGLLCCEQVVIEEITKNVTAVNCFNNRRVETFPVAFSFVVYAMLIDGIGDIGLEVTIQRADSLEEIFRRSLSYRFVDPLREVRCMVRIRNCSFSRPGAYQVSLLADNEIIAQKKIRVLPKGAAQ